MTKLEIFNAPTSCSCTSCSNDSCSTSTSTKITDDIEWLKSKGIEATSYNPGIEPEAFRTNELVMETLKKYGPDCLPLTILNNEILFKGKYPGRAILAEYFGLKYEEEQEEEIAEKSSCGCSGGCSGGCGCGSKTPLEEPTLNERLKTAAVIAAMLIIACILLVKLTATAGATETQTPPQTQQTTNPEGFVSSIAEAKKSGQDTIFIFVPSKTDLKMSILTQTAIIAAQGSLKTKKVTSKLYTLDSTSADYAAIAKKNKLPAIVVVGKTGNKCVVSGKITMTKLLDAYIQVSPLGCPASTP